MHKLEIKRKRRIYRFTFPSSFDELTADQLEFVIPHLPDWTGRYTKFRNSKYAGFKKTPLADFHLQEARIQALVYLTGVYKLKPWSRRGKAFFSMYPDEVAEALKLLNWLFESPNRYVPPYPKLRIGFATWFPAADRLTNLSGEEFHFATRFYQQYQNRDHAALDKLIAILYRPAGRGPAHHPTHPDYSGDQRLPFNRHHLDHLADKVSHLRDKQKLAILFWFGCCLHYYTTAYPQIFTKGNQQEASKEGWLPIWRAMAKGMLQTEEVAQKRLVMILYELREMQREYKEHKDRMRKMKVVR